MFMTSRFYQRQSVEKFVDYLAAFLVVSLITMLCAARLYSLHPWQWYPPARSLVDAIMVTLFFVNRIWRLVGMGAIVVFCLFVIYRPIPSKIEVEQRMEKIKQIALAAEHPPRKDVVPPTH